MSITTLIIDTETTGLPSHRQANLDKQPYIIEFAATKIFGNGIRIMYSSLINPGIDIPEDAIKIHGITNDILEDAPDFLSLLPTLVDAFSDVDVVIAHNVSFDRRMINIELERIGLPHILNSPAVWFCTAAMRPGERGRYQKLTDLYRQVTGNKLNQKHRALDDVAALETIVDNLNLINQIEKAIDIRPHCA